MFPLNARYSNHGMSGSDMFPNVFFDAASLAMPETIQTAMHACEHIWYAAGTYRSAMERVVAYFSNDVRISGIDKEPGDDERDKYMTFLHETLDIININAWMMRNRLAYGNSFASFIVPFKRFLVCANQRCRNQIAFDEFVSNRVFKKSWSMSGYSGHCPLCNTSGRFLIQDLPADLENELILKIWSPHEIRLEHDLYTGNNTYYWQIPREYAADVVAGRDHVIKHAPKGVIEAIRLGVDYRFDPDAIYHMKEPTLAGIRNRGWGIPRTLWCFRQIYYVQLLHRYNEAIALDYVIPWRLFTPPAARGDAASEPVFNTNLGDFSSMVNAMIRKRRADPASVATLPFPVNYQVLGGEAKNLAPFELINQGNEELLNAAQVPVEFYKPSLSGQALPGAMRLFEATWQPLVHDLNAFLRWLVRRLSMLMSWEYVNCRLVKPRHADDIQRQMHLLQLMASQVVSQTTGLRSLDVDPREEQRQLADEARYSAEQQARVQEEAEQQAFAEEMAKGAPPPQAAPAAPGAPPAPATGPTGQTAQQVGGGAAPPTAGMMMPAEQAPQTPQEVEQFAESKAQELLGLSESAKRQQLAMIKQQSGEVVHSYVLKKLEDIRNNARAQGGDQILQQQFGRA